MANPQVAQFAGRPDPADGQQGASLQVAEGTSIRLAWKVTGARGVRIQPDVGELPADRTSILVTPSADVDYLLTALGKDGVLSKPSKVHVAVHPSGDLVSSHLAVLPPKPDGPIQPVLVEFADELFRFNSAVLLPEGQTPDGQGNTVDGVGPLGQVIFFAFTNPEKQILVTGHTDTVGTGKENILLSEWRAFAVLAAIIGDHEGFADAAMSHKDQDSLHQIFDWAADTFGMDCKGKTFFHIKRFQQAFNQHAGAPVLQVDNSMGRATWKAVAQLYDEALAQELHSDLESLAQIRANLLFVSPPVFVGCGENHPIEGKGLDNFKSQTNRRVEVLFFDPDEVPQFPCHPGPEQCNPALCQVFDTPNCVRSVLTEADLADWTASWDRASVKMGETAQMVLKGGLHDGERVQFEVSLDGFGPLGQVEAEVQGGQAVAQWDEWFRPEFVDKVVHLGPNGAFPQKTFSFTAGRFGHSAASGPLAYADSLHARVVFDSSVPLHETDYLVCTAFGTRKGKTAKDGTLVENGLPPGGATLVPAKGPWPMGPAGVQ